MYSLLYFVCSWQSSWSHIRCLRMNLGQSQARQVPSLLYYLSSPLVFGVFSLYVSFYGWHVFPVTENSCLSQLNISILPHYIPGSQFYKAKLIFLIVIIISLLFCAFCLNLLIISLSYTNFFLIQTYCRLLLIYFYQQTF